jgi:hypothetical protein
MCSAQRARLQASAEQHAQTSEEHPTWEHASADPPAAEAASRCGRGVAVGRRAMRWEAHGVLRSWSVRGPWSDESCVTGTHRETPGPDGQVSSVFVAERVAWEATL